VVALVLLAEAHMAVTVTFRHAGMVHHKKVDVEIVRASSLHLVVLCPDKLDHLDTASLALANGRHVRGEDCVVEGVMAPWVIKGIAFEAFDGASRHAIAPGGYAG